MPNIIFELLLWALLGSLPGFYAFFARGYDTRLGLALGAVAGVLVGVVGVEIGIITSAVSAIIVIIGLLAIAMLLLPDNEYRPQTDDTQHKLLVFAGGAAIIVFLLVGANQAFFGQEAVIATVLTAGLLLAIFWLSRDTEQRAPVLPRSIALILAGVTAALGVFAWLVNSVAIVFIVAVGVLAVIFLVPRGHHTERQTSGQRIGNLAYALTVPTVLIVTGIVIFPVIWNVIFSLRDIEVADLRDVELLNLTDTNLENYTAQAGLRIDTVPCEQAEDGTCERDPETDEIEYVNPRSYFDDYRGWREFTGVDQGDERLVVGTRNDEFYPMIFRTFFYTLASTLFAILFGLLAALVVREAFPGRAVFRGFILFPYIAPVISVAFVWDALLRQRGFINGVLDANIDFLGTRDTFIGISIPLIMVILFQTWRYFPFAFLFLLARLQAIPEDMYEAAKVDGATPSQRLWFITLPQLRAVFGTLFLLRFIWTFNKFDDIFLLTGSIEQTRVIPIQIYEALFNERNVGEASAIAVIMALLLAVILMIYFRYFLVEEA